MNIQHNTTKRVNRVTYQGPDNEHVLIDLTKDTATPETILAGYTAHGANGALFAGTYKPSTPSAPVLEEKTVTENGVYTPPSGVDGFSKVTVNVPQSGGPVPFTVAWGTELPETVVENQFFMVCFPESEDFHIDGAVVADDNIFPYQDTEWMMRCGVWLEKIVNPNVSWENPETVDVYSILMLKWTLDHTAVGAGTEPFQIQFANANLVIYPLEAEQTSLWGETFFIPSYIGRNGKWERFCEAETQGYIEWPEGH